MILSITNVSLNIVIVPRSYINLFGAIILCKFLNPTIEKVKSRVSSERIFNEKLPSTFDTVPIPIFSENTLTPCIGVLSS